MPDALGVCGTIYKVKIQKQAGAELGQAQLKLGLGFTSIKFGLPDSGGIFVFKKLCCIYNI